MLKGIALLSIIIFSGTLTVNAQTYEIDQINSLPFIDKENILTIATSVWTLYKIAIENPQEASTILATKETVYGYYDTRHRGKLDKVNPIQGKVFLLLDSSELKKNNHLLFNMSFAASGELIIPNKIYVISNRWSDGFNGE